MAQDQIESLLTEDGAFGAPEPQHGDEWSADRLWHSTPNFIRDRVKVMLNNRQPELLQFYQQELVVATTTFPDVANDPTRYIGFPIIEATTVVDRVKRLVNYYKDRTISYDWLSLYDENRLETPTSSIATAPHYLPLKVLLDEVEINTGIRLNPELHDELSANQTQYYISWFLIEATDIKWSGF